MIRVRQQREQEYKSLRLTVITCATLVTTRTHTQTAFDRLYYQLSQLSYKPELCVTVVISPGSHWDDLVGTDAEMFLSTRCMSCVDAIHQFQQLFNALILTQVLTTFHQVTILLLVIAANCYALWTSN